MKALLLIPRAYSLLNTVKRGFEANGIDTVWVEYETFFNPGINRFVSRFETLPNKIKNRWKEPYVRKLNAGYKKQYDLHQPEFVFIYNNQLILPDTLIYFRRKSKIIFFLGDNPLYTPTSEFNLTILYQADYIICPDTFWIAQLERIGVPNLHFGVFGFDDSVFYPFEPDKKDLEKYGSELVYVGTAQKTNWGFKRFMFLNLFRKFKFDAYITGNAYTQKWKNWFPELEKNIIPHQINDPVFNNLVCNCSKLYPVDLVPSLFNGIHIRIMDCIGSGILPVIEYSADLDLVFRGIEVPVLRNYNNAEPLVKKYLQNDVARINVVKALREYVIDRYEPGKVLRKIVEDITD